MKPGQPVAVIALLLVTQAVAAYARSVVTGAFSIVRSVQVIVN